MMIKNQCKITKKTKKSKDYFGTNHPITVFTGPEGHKKVLRGKKKNSFSPPEDNR